VDLETAVELAGAAIDRNAATVLVGAGLSQAAGYPGWSSLLEPFLAEFDLNEEEFHDLPMLAQFVAAQEGGRRRLVEHVSTAINTITNDATTQPTVDHRLLVE